MTHRKPFKIPNGLKKISLNKTPRRAPLRVKSVYAIGKLLPP